MQREFSVNILLLITINLLVKPFYIFGIDRSVQNAVGTESYGIYFTLLSFAYLLQIVNDFGIQNYNSREISQNRHLIHKFFPNILSVKLLLGAVFVAGVMLVAWLSGYAIHFHLLVFIALNQVFTSLLLFLRTNIAGLGYYRADSLLSVLDKVLMILICGWLLWGPLSRAPFRIEWFVYAQTASILLSGLVAWYLLNWRFSTRISFRFRMPIAMLVLKRSFPFALVILLMTLYTRMDVIMLEKMLPNGIYHAGVYGAAYRLLDAANMIGFLFATLLMPMFSRMLKTGEPVGTLVQHSFRIIFTGAVVLSVSVFFYRHEIMHLLYLEATPYFGEVLGWLMLSFIGVGGTYIYGTLLTANGSVGKMNRIFAFSILANIFLNALLIPRFEAVGAAVATLGTQLGVFLAQVFLAKQLLKLERNLRLVGQAILFFSGSLLLGGVFYQMTFHWWIAGFLGLATVLSLYALLIKLLNFKFLYELIGRK